MTVAICTRNRSSALRNAMFSVLSQIDDDTELLIVDNDSTDDTFPVATTLAAQHPCVTVCQESIRGIAAARNTALARAQGEFVLFFDDDELAEAGWLKAYREFLLRHDRERVGCVGGGIVPLFETKPPRWFIEKDGSFDMGEREMLLTGRATPGCGNAAYNRATALKHGGFCLGLQRYEESDLNARLARNGYELWWLPGARIQHLTPASRLSVRWRTRNAFVEGRSVALVRLRSVDGALPRLGYRLARLLTSPLQFAAMVLAALLAMPFRSGQITVQLLIRAARVMGIMWGMVKRSNNI